LFAKMQEASNDALVAIAPELVKKLQNIELFKSNSQWTMFIASVSRIEESIELLDYYYSNLIKQEEKSHQEPMTEEEFLKMDNFSLSFGTNLFSIMDDSLTSAMIFSLELLAMQRIENELIEKIALNEPKHCPDSFTYELWIQRKAFLICVKKQGISFIMKNLEKVRTELLFYGLTNVQFSDSDLLDLRAVLIDRSHRDTSRVYLENTDLIELIERKRINCTENSL